jgi:hypothetical protein
MIRSLICTLLIVLSAGGCRDRSRPADAVVRGIALGLFASDPEYDYGPLLAEIAEEGATDVLLVVQWEQEDVGSDVITARPAPITRTLRQARGRGLRISLMPIVQLRERASHEWRGQLRPRDGAPRWFRSYRRLLSELARTAQEAGAVRLGIGSELSTLEPYAEEWREAVREVRRLFAGRLFYSLNWDALSGAPFLDAVDEIGVAAYFNLAGLGVRPNHAALLRAWEAPRARLRELRARYGGKTLLLTELGYPSLSTAAWRPWDDAAGSAQIDLGLQQTLYEAFCAAFSERGGSEIGGFFAWNWFGFGGPTDRGYTPRGKPAAASLRRCLLGFR